MGMEREDAPVWGCTVSAALLRLDGDTAVEWDWGCFAQPNPS